VGEVKKGGWYMSKVAELRSKLEEVERAGLELEALGKTREELIAKMEGLRELLQKARNNYDHVVTEYAGAILLAEEINERGKELSRVTGTSFQTINLPGKYGYPGNVHPNGPSARTATNSLAIHEGLVPAIFGGDVFELLRQKRARR
jgi:hypothetical protein